jgi:hypothetical protein
MTERSMTIMGQMGDLEIAWEEQNDDAMREFIERKLKEGVTFFVYKPTLGGLLPNRKVELKKIKDLDRHLLVKDPDVAALVASQVATLQRRDQSLASQTPVSSRNAAEIARSRSVGTPAMQGG